MGKIGERIKQFQKTFGIEIEFCSHDSDLLSFTHIEVCIIKHDKFEWKIETDADYTLELVSPIVDFDDQTKANEYKRRLMVELDRIVRAKPTLDRCVTEISNYLRKSEIKYYDPATKEKKTVKSNAHIQVQYTSRDNLVQELDFHNWDTDTNLERVIALKEKIENDRSFDDAKVAELLKGVILSPSKKHGGLPSSQLNHPLSLENYVWYSINVKEPRAWLRLISAPQDDFLQRWRQKKFISILKQYEHLEKDEKWRRRYLNDDYLERRQNKNIPIWHRYWFWLVSIREITSKALKEDRNKDVSDIKDLIMGKNSLDDLINHHNKNDYHRFRETEVEFLDIKQQEIILENNIDVITIKIPKDVPLPSAENLPQIKNISSKNISSLYRAMYVTIHKLISGALGELSENEQSKLQKMIMDMKGELDDANVLKSCVENPEFLDFHYALKDLTPLWFKGALGDVLQTLDRENLDNLEKNLSSLESDDVEKILNDNLKFLGRLYTLNEYFHHGNHYDWDKFKEDLLPSVSGFVRQFEKSKQSLLRALEGNSIKSSTYEALHNKTKDNKFLDRTNVPPWEGRWDTMKPPMQNKEGIKEGIEFLVEHRNN